MENQSDWESFWKRSKRSSISWSKKRILNVLDPYLKKNLAIMDAGCGRGFFSAYFCDKGLKTTSVDYSQKALTLTSEATLNRATIVKIDVLSENLYEKLKMKFDLIFSDGLFEHFSRSQQDTIFRHFSGILSDAGYLITFVPNVFSPWTLLRPFMMPEIEEKPFTIGELIKMNERNNYKIISWGGVNVLPWKISPEKLFPTKTAMLIYTISQKDKSLGSS